IIYRLLKPGQINFDFFSLPCRSPPTFRPTAASSAEPAIIAPFIEAVQTLLQNSLRSAGPDCSSPAITESLMSGDWLQV
ncbi:MAG: hypothetical protein ABIR35_04105, partial [Polaromonas sp.]